ncbi:1-deoxy-D-xylulose-5-phosphate synthase 1 [Streptomyces longisporoflavus]|uniref:1-deoxy-D-xylulose-5-phosphate synthase N-terminal domain-containing protein n=1 Tax=Streptomyces longisporoflavus TaxID=28044 RepID=UPI00167EF210|nr:1-deoxy-D-xylulose-5-phosphate synthase N-terminal domain-containing protein [Streptomyces longisporoflavus]GGV61838.1 1-deoxy-D-xylulose-5-phosphate synthase 1 [Streptomyces longisporoflavus]
MPTPKTPPWPLVLDDVYGPHDVRALPPARLPALAAEVRESLAPSPGADATVELGIALHRVFDSARDQVAWDSPTASFAHELLRDRRAFASRTGSVAPLGGRALSYAEGLARAFLLGGRTDRHAIAVVDSATLATDAAREALDSLARNPGLRIVVVVHGDGGPPRGARGGLTGRIGGALRRAPLVGTGLYDALGGPGLEHTGPVDGRSPARLESALRAARDAGRPVVVHCVTPGRAVAGRSAGPPARSWAAVFAGELAEAGAERPDVVAVSAARRLPPVFAEFAAMDPERAFAADGSREHAAYCAAGLAAEGLHPVVAGPCGTPAPAVGHGHGTTFVLDGARSPAGLPDGVRCSVPRDGARLRVRLREALGVADAPTAVCFPEGPVAPDVEAVAHDRGLDVLCGARQLPGDVLVVSVGAMAGICLEAARLLDERGVGVTVVDPGWVDPPPARLGELAAEHALTVTVRDGVPSFAETGEAVGGAPLTGAVLAESVALRLGELHDACG